MNQQEIYTHGETHNVSRGDAHNDTNDDTNDDNYEPLLDPKYDRLVTKPIEKMFEPLWDNYKIQSASFWQASDIDFKDDARDFKELNNDEQQFVKMVLAFFAASDQIVNLNISERFINEIQVLEARICYQFQAAMENIHCVSGDTEILTDTGNIKIGDYVNKNVNVWNGTSFSNVEIVYTGDSVLYLITLSNGLSLKCTPNHKWFINTSNIGITKEIVYTVDLKIGDKICNYTLPIVVNNIKENLNFIEKFVHENNGKFLIAEKLGYKRLITSSTNLFLLKNAQMKLIELGIKSEIDVLSVSRDKRFEIIDEIDNTIFILRICNNELKQLQRFGLSFNNIEIIDDNNMDTYDCGYWNCIDELHVSDITLLENEHKTYCFTEQINHAGIFNGILTGQSEVYSDMLLNVVEDKEEQHKLFNAFKTIPSIKRISDWAFQWKDSDKSLGHRIIAFAIVEGIFFSGAFACIFWLKKQRNNGKSFMNGLVKSNEYIARDEGMHVKYACQLYSYIKKRVHFDEVKKIFDEANDISKQFMEEAIQCKLIGMNNDLMNQYINYVSDRLLVMLGYDKIYNATNPFSFMETIGILSKDNFFEKRVTAYQTAYNADNQDDREFDILNDF